MGRKVNPIAFRIGTVRDWRAKWHADKHFVEYLQEDIKIRKAIAAKYKDAGVSTVEIERQANKVSVNIHTSRPGIVIGRGGSRVDEMRHHLEEVIGKKVQLNILEVAQPELDAYLVSRAVAEQIERRIAYRRAMKQAIFRSIQAGAEGIKISASGRLGGAEIARRQVMHQGRVPLHTIRADIDYGVSQAYINMGRIGIKVWIYRGDILPERREEVFEEAPAAADALVEEVMAPATEVAVEAPAEEKAAKPKAKKAAKPKVEPAAEVAIEAPAAEKPAKPKAKKVAKTKATVAEVKAPAEEKAAKPKAKKVTKPKAAAAEVKAPAAEKPAKPKAKKIAKPKVAAAETKTAEKPAKPKAKKVAKPKAAAEAGKKPAATKKAAPKAKKKVEKKDATT